MLISCKSGTVSRRVLVALQRPQVTDVVPQAATSQLSPERQFFESFWSSVWREARQQGDTTTSLTPGHPRSEFACIPLLGLSFPIAYVILDANCRVRAGGVWVQRGQ